ncbi:UNVERIFIED_CONTAM: Beta-glucuronosyltransferase GlcAT14B [Sesamum radiatum]|uniref:Beta-glucuronosyltransferase GlcAT14B n=1 Tax=Sesamum radiatum TaxID=300843 RepID=A0AAW2VQV8_SESRA
MVANSLHAAAILLKEGGHWDWFINLSASDYPLVTQDGSAWMALSRPFIDYCIWGWDNLPRMALMYYTNFLSSPEGYFHTVICNAQEFSNTTVNSDLHFISWDNPPKQHPHYLYLKDMQRMVESNAPFARKFHHDDPVLDKIDSELLFRGKGMLVPGGWCVGSRENGTDPCSVACVAIFTCGYWLLCDNRFIDDAVLIVHFTEVNVITRKNVGDELFVADYQIHRQSSVFEVDGE